MDFSFSEEHEAVQALARQIFGENVSHERLLELEKSGDWFDAKLWKQLADANLTSICVPEAQGGGGMGLVELCLVLEEQGRRVAPVPLCQRNSARTHHSRDQSPRSQCSTSSVPRGSASRFRSRCSRNDAFGFTRSIGTPT